jgi:hypothetical protein
MFAQEWEDALIKHKVMDAPLDHAKMRFMLDMKHEDEAFIESKRDVNATASLAELEVRTMRPNPRRRPKTPACEDGPNLDGGRLTAVLWIAGKLCGRR